MLRIAIVEDNDTDREIITDGLRQRRMSILV